ncbi:MAG: TolB family protein [Blastocatellia bacterium]
MKFFNTAGPCNPEDHYMLPAAARLPEMRELIDQKAYFVVHAPRQIGKTTMMMKLARELTAEGRYLAVMLLLTGDNPTRRSPAVSPDGKLIACYSFDPQYGQRRLVVIPFEGGAPLKTLDDKGLDTGPIPPRWTPDGRALIYLDERQGSTNLWRMPLGGSPPQQVTNFNDAKPERIWSFDLSRDGKQLVIARGGQTADVVLISEVK